jgi:hypothetical protein
VEVSSVAREGAHKISAGFADNQLEGMREGRP